jgi:LacI family transcriptional regulator
VVPERPSPVTLREVARAAGVSTASASRALTREGAVSADLRRRILAAAERLGYAPNLAARVLAGRGSGLVGVLVKTLEDPLLAAAIMGLEHRLAHAGYGVLIAASGASPGQSLLALRALLGRGAEALVLAEPAHAEELAAAIHTRGVPYAGIGERASGGERGIDLGQRRGAALAGRYLLDLGHRRIAVIAPASSGMAGAVAETLAGTGAARFPDGMRPAQDPAEAQHAMRVLLDGQTVPTAVICGSDLLAMAALRECLRRGIAVPREVSIIGFGDAEFARRAVPALTTLRVLPAELGARVAASLLLSLQHGDLPPAIEAPVKLVVRESTGPAPR